MEVYVSIHQIYKVKLISVFSLIENFSHRRKIPIQLSLSQRINRNKKISKTRNCQKFPSLLTFCIKLYRAGRLVFARPKKCRRVKIEKPKEIVHEQGNVFTVSLFHRERFPLDCI